MCGIAGIIYKNGNDANRVGADMTRMLQSMKHRGPDSTGYALYRRPSTDLIMRIKLADGAANGDVEYADRLRRRRREVEARLRAAGTDHRKVLRVCVESEGSSTGTAHGTSAAR